MNSKFLINVAVGAVTFLALGYLIYELALGAYLAEHTSGAGEVMIWWSLILAQLGLAGLAAIAVKWKGAGDFMGGAKAAASVGTLYATAYAFDIYASTSMADLSAVGVIWMGETLRFFVAGGVIAWFSNRKKSD